jgi:hypothetical protein
MRNRRRAVSKGGYVACALAAGVLLGGCRDSGLPGRNTPVEEAMTGTSPYPLYEAADPRMPGGPAIFTVGEQRWLSQSGSVAVPRRLLRPVGATGGYQIHALTWDDAPYGMLFATAPNGTVRPLARIN